MGDFRAEALFNARDGIFRVLDGVVKERSGQSGGIEAHVGEDVRNLEKVREIGLAGLPELGAVPLRGNFIGAADHPGIFRRAVLAELFKQLLEARIELANRAVKVEAERDFVGRRHSLVYA
jgi:hypothetical protein